MEIGPHVPAPSQYVAVNVGGNRPSHDVLHTVLTSNSWQAPLPLHRPLLSQLVGSGVPQRGSGWLTPMAAHIPSLPAMSHR